MKRPIKVELKGVADIALLSIAAVMLAPIVLMGLFSVVLLAAALWPLLILPVLGFNRLISRGEEQIDEVRESIGAPASVDPPERALPYPV